MNSAPIKPLISTSDRDKIDVRIGTILAVEDVDSAVLKIFETSGRNLRRRPLPASGAEVKNSATEIRSNNSKSSAVQNLGANRRACRFMAPNGPADLLSDVCC